MSTIPTATIHYFHKSTLDPISLAFLLLGQARWTALESKTTTAGLRFQKSDVIRTDYSLATYGTTPFVQLQMQILFNSDWSQLPVSRQVSRKAQFSTAFQYKVGKIRILTGTMVFEARVDEIFVFINKLISE